MPAFFVYARKSYTKFSRIPRLTPERTVDVTVDLMEGSTVDWGYRQSWLNELWLLPLSWNTTVKVNTVRYHGLVKSINFKRNLLWSTMAYRHLQMLQTLHNDFECRHQSIHVDQRKVTTNRAITLVSSNIGSRVSLERKTVKSMFCWKKDPVIASSSWWGRKSNSAIRPSAREWWQAKDS